MRSKGPTWPPWWPANRRIYIALRARAKALTGATFNDLSEMRAAVIRAVRKLDIEKPTKEILLAIIATIEKEDLW